MGSDENNVKLLKFKPLDLIEKVELTMLKNTTIKLRSVSIMLLGFPG